LDAYLQIRISKELKDNFSNLAAENNTDASSLVRGWVNDYVKKHERRTDMDVLEKLYEDGYKLKEALGGFDKAKRHAWELNNLVSNELDQFVEKVMTLHVKTESKMPKEILDTRDNISLAQAFVMGMLGEKRT
jgi:hypothetical protein